MRAVLDTNAIVSGMLSAEGPCGRILDLVVDGSVTPCVDDRILREYRDVCRRPELGLLEEDVDRVIGLLEWVSERIHPLPIRADLPDSDDLPFLEAARSATVTLVTGNRKHFPKRARGEVRVLTPREFLSLLGDSSQDP